MRACKAQGISPEKGIVRARSGAGIFSTPRERGDPWLRSHDSNRRRDTMAVDPICKMDVDPKTAKWKSNYNGKEYYFCAPGCKKAFDRNPEKYA